MLELFYMHVHAQEVGHERPQSREAYLTLFQQEWDDIHEGTSPELGVKEKGSAELKEICEDVKLKNQGKGIFLVADGVSSASGWLAARATARIMYERLGEELDRGIENNSREALENKENALDRITQFVASQMIAAIEQADTTIRALTVNERIAGSATTLSLAKLVELSDGSGGKIQRLFFTNVGDSRIYVQRKDTQLKRITKDDSRLQARVEAGELTQQEADKLDQVVDQSKLERSKRRHLLGSNMITKFIGMGYAQAATAEVFYLDLQPGDRLVIVSDGVSDQILETEMQSSLDAQTDDDQAEEALQNMAVTRSRDGLHPRAKGDDISALVHTIGERGPSREYLKLESPSSRSQEVLRDDRQNYKQALDRVRNQILMIENQIARLGMLEPKREKLILMIALEEAHGTKNALVYHLEKAQLEIFELDLPPRFHTGDQVEVWRDDFDPPSLDRSSWRVSQYDDSTRMYTVLGNGMQSQEVSRYELEKVQGGLLARVGDVLPVENEQGVLEKGFKIIGIDEDSTVVLIQEKDGVLIRARVPVKSINDQYLNMMHRAEGSRQRMEQAYEDYQVSQERLQTLKMEQTTIEMLESQQRAKGAAQ
jgi:serine/threonine protein phosphatase PrpC